MNLNQLAFRKTNTDNVLSQMTQLQVHILSTEEPFQEFRYFGCESYTL